MRYAQLIKLIVLSVPLCLGCASAHPALIPACATDLGTPLSEGTLRILPSEIPTITIDSARWEAVTGPQDLITVTSVYYLAYFSSTSTIPLSEVALQFRSTKLSEEGFLVVTEAAMWKKCRASFDCIQAGRDSIRPGEPRRVMGVRFVSGKVPGPWGCPQSAQVVVWDRPSTTTAPPRIK